MDEAAPRAALRDVGRKGHDSSGQVRTHRVGNTLFQGAFPGQIGGSYVCRVDGERIPAPKRTGERNRVEVDSIPCPNDRLFAETVGQTDARGEQFVADRNSGIVRHCAAATEVYEVRVGIVPLDAFSGPGHERIELITQAEVDGQVSGYLPPVARVPPELPLAARHENVLQA